MMKKCPGVKDLVQPNLIIRSCPICGDEVEFFTDETKANCSRCNKTLHREATASCVTWCQYAEACIADLEKRGIVPPSRAEELKKRCAEKISGA